MKKSLILGLGLWLGACSFMDKPLEKQPKATLMAGQKIAFSVEKGNCLACHQIEGGEFAGNIAPELKSLPSKFTDKSQLRAFVWDATKFNPNTSMPPFGRNKILTEDELTQLVDYLWELK